MELKNKTKTQPFTTDELRGKEWPGGFGEKELGADEIFSSGRTWRSLTGSWQPWLRLTLNKSQHHIGLPTGTPPVLSSPRHPLPRNPQGQVTGQPLVFAKWQSPGCSPRCFSTFYLPPCSSVRWGCTSLGKPRGIVSFARSQFGWFSCWFVLVHFKS